MRQRDIERRAYEEAGEVAYMTPMEAFIHAHDKILFV